VNVQSCVGYWVCFGTRGIVLCKSRDVRIVQDAGGEINTGRKEDEGVGGKKGYIYLSSCDLIHILRLLVNEHIAAQLSSCTTTRHLINKEPRDEIQYLP